MLDLKYRPLVFDDVVGNQGPVLVLRKRSTDRSLSKRSILLGGPKGCGKTTLARIVSRSVSCQYIADGNPCNECDLCIAIIKGSSLSHREFDAATSGTVENIRAIVDSIEYQNIDGTDTVIIIDEAHRLSIAAQDALLKAMEERLLFLILCTTEPSKMRPALRDRVDEYAIKPPSKLELLKFLEGVCAKENINYEKDALSILVDHCERSPRMCLNEINSINFQGKISRSFVEEYYRYSSKKQIANALNYLSEKVSITISELTSVGEKESPLYIRDIMIQIISNSIRNVLDVPVKPGIPVIPMNRADILSWSNVGKSLSLIEKPSISDIEIVLFSCLKITDSPKLTYEAKSFSKSSADLVEPDLKINILKSPNVARTEKVTPGKTIEIDGVKYSSEEILTSVDSKMLGSRGPVQVESSKPIVEWDKSKIPMSEQEFSHGFIQRLKFR